MLRLLRLLLILIAAPAYAADTVWLEDMTWPEVKARVSAGASTVIVPTGGTEQNGPHLPIGKHNIIVQRNAEAAARELGNTLVAPVVAYVPEGTINPPEGHMLFPGTISVTEQTFAALLEDTARSLKQHGFKLICFIGDHGGNQNPQAAVAEKLSKEWRKEGVRVLQVADYYGNNGQAEWAAAQKIPGDIQAHAGFADTSEMLAIKPEMVRRKLITVHGEKDFETTGVKGDPSHASAAYGKQLLALKTKAAVEQIRHAREGR